MLACMGSLNFKADDDDDDDEPWWAQDKREDWIHTLYMDLIDLPNQPF